ncbi:hypothetical protein CCP4SC76_4350002 [Gammaproteobacteria bacterium]
MRMSKTGKSIVQNGNPYVRRHPLEDGGFKITTHVPLQFKRGVKKVVVGPQAVVVDAM